jgi:hypothetical protein
MGKVIGKNIHDRGIYQATELMGRGLVSLKLIGVSEAPKEGFTTIKISEKTARKIGAKKQPGETLAQACERLLLAALTRPSLGGLEAQSTCGSRSS